MEDTTVQPENSTNNSSPRSKVSFHQLADTLKTNLHQEYQTFTTEVEKIRDRYHAQQLGAEDAATQIETQYNRFKNQVKTIEGDLLELAKLAKHQQDEQKLTEFKTTLSDTIKSAKQESQNFVPPVK
jgi:biotin-(acetyl-CoA carboxylase) ligase